MVGIIVEVAVVVMGMNVLILVVGEVVVFRVSMLRVKQTGIGVAALSFRRRNCCCVTMFA